MSSLAGAKTRSTAPMRLTGRRWSGVKARQERYQGAQRGRRGHYNEIWTPHVRVNSRTCGAHLCDRPRARHVRGICASERPVSSSEQQQLSLVCLARVSSDLFPSSARAGLGAHTNLATWRRRRRRHACIIRSSYLAAFFLPLLLAGRRRELGKRAELLLSCSSPSHSSSTSSLLTGALSAHHCQLEPSSTGRAQPEVI